MSKQARIPVIPQGTFEITADLTDAAIDSATLHQLQDASHHFSIHTGEEIQKNPNRRMGCEICKRGFVLQRETTSKFINVCSTK